MTIEPDNAGRMQGGQFAPGCSGNPAGMKLGTRHRTARLVQRMMSDVPSGVAKAMDVLLSSNTSRMSASNCTRIPSPSATAPDSAKARPVRLDLPPIVSAADLVKALAAVADAMARGVLSAEEAQAAAAVLEHHRKAVETFDLERRITAIENMQKPNER
jgi:hypothetical protein